MEHTTNQMLAGFYQDVQRYIANFLVDNRLSELVIKLETPMEQKMMRGLLNYSFDFISSTEDKYIRIKMGNIYLTAEYIEDGGEFTFDEFVKLLYRNAYMDDLEVKKTIQKALFKESLDYGLAYLRLSK